MHRHPLHEGRPVRAPTPPPPPPTHARALSLCFSLETPSIRRVDVNGYADMFALLGISLSVHGVSSMLGAATMCEDADEDLDDAETGPKRNSPAPTLHIGSKSRYLKGRCGLAGAPTQQTYMVLIFLLVLLHLSPS